jgi:outer membrane protein OmpA-like peptidoglycan-associated protein
MSPVAHWLFAPIAAAVWISPNSAQAEVAPVATGVVVIEATQPNGLADDCADVECSNGPVAKAIVAALASSKITIAGLFDQVSVSVAAATNGRQVPWMAASSPIDVPLAAEGSHALALVIGNGAYTQFPALTGAPRDAKAVGERLSSIGFQTKTLINADGASLAKEIAAFFQSLGAGDSAVVYYSGHGFSVNGVGYLPPLAGELRNADALSRSSIVVATVTDAFSRSKAARKLLILDTHYPPLAGADRTLRGISRSGPIPGALDHSVNFAANSADLTAAGRRELDRVALVLTRPEIDKCTIIIHGHTDGIGSAEFNQALSERRAEAVRRYFIAQHGIDSKRLIAKGHGSSQLLLPNDPGNELNCRITFQSVNCASASASVISPSSETTSAESADR